jgi:hypothetical protein
MKKLYRPGQPAPFSGEYQIVGPKGGLGPERTVPKGHPLPPTPSPNSGYIIARRAHNNSGK